MPTATFEERDMSKLSLRAQQELKTLRKKKVFQKKKLKRISISELPAKLPDYENLTMTKDVITSEWLQKWIISSLKSKKIEVNSLLPTKQELSAYLKISIGTVQNAIRFIEDNGYVESKQRIGTIIADPDRQVSRVRKQVSKREYAITAIKKHIIDADYKIEEILPSAREFSRIIKSTSNTTRLALEYLVNSGVIKTRGYRGNIANWVLKEIPALNEEEMELQNSDIESFTLVDQVEQNLKNFISQELSVNDRLPSHLKLSQRFKISIKTLHDAMRRLVEQGILLSKLGRYGTTVLRMPDETENLQPKTEGSIFATAASASAYNYERVERHLKTLIRKSYKIGDKLPSMSSLSSDLDVSSNTIRKALQLLAKENVVEFVRGRYGGTFIINAPKITEASSFTWLSVNPQHAELYK